MYRKVVTAALTLLLALAFVPRASAVVEKCPDAAPRAKAPTWPAAPERGAFDVVHFGEGHWNEGQGPETMPILVADVVAFDPDFVAFSSDMADIGTPDRLGCFRMLMDPLVRAGVPWFDSPGNHDRVALAGPGGIMGGGIDIWREVFAAMPAPWGDAPPAGKDLRVPEGEDDDGKGASTHYYFDYGRGKPALRLIALDNSQHSFTNSDFDQYPPVGPGHKDPSQLAFLNRTATSARDDGLLTWVLMHQPTRDPRDHSKAHPTSYNHTMSKGASADNILFDLVAAQSGVDAVLLGHIQGNALYSFQDVQYFIDGGGGGSPYSAGPVGIDTGYYYGFRILRVFKDDGEWNFRTYFVPLVDKLKAKVARTIAAGEELTATATAIQPFDPDLEPRFGGAPHAPIEVELRAPSDAELDRAALPEVSYVWTTSNPKVLRPVAGDIDPTGDPIFDAKTMTTSGRFEALRPGKAVITIEVGTHARSFVVTVTGGE